MNINFADPLNNDIHENWYSTFVFETTVLPKILFFVNFFGIHNQMNRKKFIQVYTCKNAHNNISHRF